MKKNICTIIFLFVWVFTHCSNPELRHKRVVLYDLNYLNLLDITQPNNVKTVWDHAHTLATLQGVVNRDEPNLYLFYIENEGVNIDRYWWDKYRREGEWLSQIDTVIQQNIIDLIAFFKNNIEGAVVYDPNVKSTSNVASAVAGIENLIAVRYDTAANSLYHQIILNGPKIPVKKWLMQKDGNSIFTGQGIVPETSRKSSGSAKNDAYIWFIENYMKQGKCNTAYGGYYIDQHWMTNPTATRINHHTLTNHDFFVSKRGFFFDLSPWPDEPATDDPQQPVGTDLNTLKELLLLAYRHNNHGKTLTYIGGFPPWAFKYTKHANGTHEDVATEWEYSRIISAYNAFKDADAISYGGLANASFWQHFPLQEKYPQDWISREELQKRGFLNDDGKLATNKKFYIFYVGDYDASSWVSQTTPTIWDRPERGQVPLMWCISPVLEERVPMALHYRRQSATGNDYFAAADNGAGYLMPGMLQEPRPVSALPDATDDWAGHNLPYFNRWDLSITGFIIDGHAPALNKSGLDAYEKFSPNGIVPQKSPPTLLHGKMPVLKSDLDVNNSDPKEAARIIVERIKERNIPFHWFRNILKRPEWYVKVVDEVKKLNPDVELLEAPAFFELYRIYLEQNIEAAKGKP